MRSSRSLARSAGVRIVVVASLEMRCSSAFASAAASAASSRSSTPSSTSSGASDSVRCLLRAGGVSSSLSLLTSIQPPESLLSVDATSQSLELKESSSLASSAFVPEAAPPSSACPFSACFLFFSSSFHFSSSSRPSIPPASSSPNLRLCSSPARRLIVAVLPRSFFRNRSAPTSR
ncbi:hypothetical protein VTK73DRAFT_10244 [Phialemonium thermophilum]|uniref:Secreted protein n=1 Tax=Phialemonium thermophilum TaxID=223376 RepID=A0ABR3VY04_9PEZI